MDFKITRPHRDDDGTLVIDEVELIAASVDTETLACPHCGNLAFRTRTKLCDSCGYSEKRQ